MQHTEWVNCDCGAAGCNCSPCSSNRDGSATYHVVCVAIPGQHALHALHPPVLFRVGEQFGGPAIDAQVVQRLLRLRIDIQE